MDAVPHGSRAAAIGPSRAPVQLAGSRAVSGASAPMLFRIDPREDFREKPICRGPFLRSVSGRIEKPPETFRVPGSIDATAKQKEVEHVQRLPGTDSPRLSPGGEPAVVGKQGQAPVRGAFEEHFIGRKAGRAMRDRLDPDFPPAGLPERLRRAEESDTGGKRSETSGFQQVDDRRGIDHRRIHRGKAVGFLPFRNPLIIRHGPHHTTHLLPLHRTCLDAAARASLS